MKARKEFTLDGEKIDIIDFIADNEMPLREVKVIRKMKVGDKTIYGGGAAATFTLKRVK